MNILRKNLRKQNNNIFQYIHNLQQQHCTVCLQNSQLPYAQVNPEWLSHTAERYFGHPETFKALAVVIFGKKTTEFEIYID